MATAFFAAGAYGIAMGTGYLSNVQCYSFSGVGCNQANAMDGAAGLALGTDETRVFVASTQSDAVAVFNRNKDNSGKLNEIACISEGGAGDCKVGNGLDGARDVVSRDNNAYVVSTDSEAVVLIKAPNGQSSDWKQPSSPSSCIAETGDGVTCNDGYGLTGARSVEIDPLQYAYVYVGGDHGIASFARNKVDGPLTEKSCVNATGTDGCTMANIPGTVMDIVIPRDGKYLYAAVSGVTGGAVLIFKIGSNGTLTQLAAPNGCISDLGDGVTCVDARALNNPEGLATDKDKSGGRNVYVAANGSDAIAVFSRNKDNGRLTQLGGNAGCVSETGSDGVNPTCADGKALADIHSVNIYKTNKFAEAAAGNGVASFARDKKTGKLTQHSGLEGCRSVDGSGGTCKVSAGLTGAAVLSSTGGKKNLYVTGTGDDAIVALLIAA